MMKICWLEYPQIRLIYAGGLRSATVMFQIETYLQNLTLAKGDFILRSFFYLLEITI